MNRLLTLRVRGGTMLSVNAADQLPMLALGSLSPDFKLPGVDGRDWALKDFAPAKVLGVFFGQTFCPTGGWTTCTHSRMEPLCSPMAEKR